MRDAKRLGAIPYPAILALTDGGFAVLAVASHKGKVRLIDPLTRSAREVLLEEAQPRYPGEAILITRRLGGAGIDPAPSASPGSALDHPLPLAAVECRRRLAVPADFCAGDAAVLPARRRQGVGAQGAVDARGARRRARDAWACSKPFCNFLRAYTLNHTTNRIDVELGRRLFHHLFRLPVAYFETRAAGQTVARVRELETIRAFLTGQGLTSLLDLVFTLVFFLVLFLYSVKLTLIIVGSIPVYLLIAGLVRPILRTQISEKFNRGARSQQFLVELIVGALTLKAASVEPVMQAQWEERLASYVSTSFDASITASVGQNLIQFVSKATTAMILFLGAEAVIDGSMTVGELIAFNMISAQVIQPILRLSQLAQDFQQAQISVARLGDILNAPPEPVPQNLLTLPPPRGAIEFRSVFFPLSPRASRRLAEHRSRHRARRGHRLCRPVGLRQIDSGEGHPAALFAADSAR